jgi:hypothetical protein
MKQFLLLSLLVSSMVSYGQDPTERTIMRMVGGDADTFQLGPSLQARVQILEREVVSFKELLQFNTDMSNYYIRQVDSLIKELRPKPLFDTIDLQKLIQAHSVDNNGWSLFGRNKGYEIVDTLSLDTKPVQVCRMISDKRTTGWTATPWPAILWRRSDGTYLDSKKHPLKPWIRVWENN